MLVVALILNILILAPVVALLWVGSAGMESALGPDSSARRILGCIYATIGLLSAGLITLHGMGHPWAVPMTLALFAMQVTYKLATVPAVGTRNPVVLTNLAVIAVQIAVVGTAWRAGLLVP